MPGILTLKFPYSPCMPVFLTLIGLEKKVPGNLILGLPNFILCIPDILALSRKCIKGILALCGLENLIFSVYPVF